jgi:peptidoglycan/xylan/chitin deacetylase (PgdA/CDA1 family)
MTYSSTYSPGSDRASHYQPSHHQPSVLELARQGNFRAIAYWLNSIFSPQGIHIQTEAIRSGCLKIRVNLQPTHPSTHSKGARQRLVRHICYRLWTLNSAEIREVRVLGRIAGQRDILWRQSVRIGTTTTPGINRLRKSTQRSKTAAQKRFQLVRSFFLNRVALAGFIFCYWLMYLNSTGQQAAEQPTIAATSPQTQAQTTGEAEPDTQQTAQPAVSQAPQPQNLTFSIPRAFQGQIISEVTPPAGAEKVIALTFDDGPWKTTTEQVLDILKQNNIKATFYMVGQAVQAHPEIAKKVVEEGHAIGNHTWRHIMEDMDELTAAEEMGNAARLIYQTTGVRTALMRPPGGNLTGSLVPYSQKKGYSVNLWSADSSDYYLSTPLIIDNVLSNARSGGIVLLHDGGGDRSQTVEALPQIISSLQKQGYKFVTMPELLQLQAQWQTMTTPTPIKEVPVTPTVQPVPDSSTITN